MEECRTRNRKSVSLSKHYKLTQPKFTLKSNSRSKERLGYAAFWVYFSLLASISEFWNVSIFSRS